MKLRVSLLIILLCGAAQLLAKEITLADASASASVVRTSSQTGYRITIVFRPVSTMDEISNREMSETLAQFYAEEALSGFLYASKTITFSKVKSTFVAIENGNTRCSFDIPAEAVLDAPVRSIEIREVVVGKKRVKAETNASTCLLDFRSSCFRDMRIAEAVYAEKIAAAKKKGELGALKQKIRSAFSVLKERIANDDNLFRAEKKELAEKADKVEAYLLGEIEAGAVKGEVGANSRLVVDAVFKKPFGDLLMGDPILLTHGGARFIEMEDGAIAVIAVGFAMSENEDREDIAELQASAALGKLLAGEETVVANRLERNYRRSSNALGVSDNMETRRSSVTRINSIDFHRSGETVGTWLSADKKRFFLAKGRIIRKQTKGGGER